MAMRWTARCLAAFGLAAAVLAAGCGGGGTDRTRAQVRFVNASPAYEQLDLIVDGTRRQSGVVYGDAQGYRDIDPDNTESVVTRTGSPTALASSTPTLARNRSYTVLAYGSDGALRTLLVDDNLDAPGNGRTLLRVVNAAPDAGPLDVYLTGSGEALASAVPVVAAAAVGAAAAPTSVGSATWHLRVTAANSKTDVRLDIPAFALAGQQVDTLVLTPGRGGVLVNALLLRQQGAITRADGTKARVRVAAGVTQGSPVTVTLGGETLLPGVVGAAVTNYRLTPAGLPTGTVQTSGGTKALSGPALLPGGDYTLLVRGGPASPLLDWLEDENRLPADSGSARLRLVNGTSDLSGPLALTADFEPVAGDVLPGAASRYGSVAANAQTQLAVGTLFTKADNRLDAGSTYSVFIFSGTGAATGVVRRDR